MISIGFIVGKGGDSYPIKFTSRRAPKWLKNQAENFRDFLDEDDDGEPDGWVPSDVALACYLAEKHPADRIECMFGFELPSKRILDEFQAIFVIYDPTEVFHTGEDGKATAPKLMRKFERALKSTSALVYPYPDFQHGIIEKFNYYAELERAGIPVAQFFRETPVNALKSISAFRRKVQERGWKGLILKPSYAGYSMGIHVFKDFGRTQDKTIKKIWEKLKKQGFPSVTCQEFVGTFGKNFEVRTYWINNVYSYSVGTLTGAVGDSGGLALDDVSTFKNEGGRLPNEIKPHLLKLGKEVLKSIWQYPIPNPLIRIDFGCCLDVEDCDDPGGQYFVNEVELLSANLLPNKTKFPIVERLANALYNFAQEMRNKKEPKGWASTYEADLVCIPPIKFRGKKR
jgi:hypothetical protein